MSARLNGPNGPEEVRRMFRLGYSIWHISAVLDVPLGTVQRWTVNG